MSEVRVMESSPMVIEVENDEGELVARTPAPGVSGIDSDWTLTVYEERPIPGPTFGMKEEPGEDGESEYRIVLDF